MRKSFKKKSSLKNKIIDKGKRYLRKLSVPLTVGVMGLSSFYSPYVDAKPNTCEVVKGVKICGRIPMSVIKKGLREADKYDALLKGIGSKATIGGIYNIPLGNKTVKISTRLYDDPEKFGNIVVKKTIKAYVDIFDENGNIINGNGKGITVDLKDLYDAYIKIFGVKPAGLKAAIDVDKDEVQLLVIPVDKQGHWGINTPMVVVGAKTSINKVFSSVMVLPKVEKPTLLTQK